MSRRRITSEVIKEVHHRTRHIQDHFGKLEKGDQFTVTGRPGGYRFQYATDNAVTGYGPVRTGREMMRSFRPEDVIMPMTFVLNEQRRERAAA